MYPVARRPSSKLIALLPAADPPPTFEDLEHNLSRACLPVTLRRNASGSRIRALLGSLARWGVYSSSRAQRSRCRQTGDAIPRARALAPGLRSRGAVWTIQILLRGGAEGGAARWVSALRRSGATATRHSAPPPRPDRS